MRDNLPTRAATASKRQDVPICVACGRRPAVVILERRAYCGACAIRLFEPPYQAERPRRKVSLADLLEGNR